MDRNSKLEIHIGRPGPVLELQAGHCVSADASDKWEGARLLRQQLVTTGAHGCQPRRPNQARAWPLIARQQEEITRSLEGGPEVIMRVGRGL